MSAPIAQTITFRAPTGAIAATVNPVAGWSGMDAQVLITGTSEARREVFAAVQNLAVACAPTYTADPGSRLTIRGPTRVEGAFTLTGTIHLGSAGHYQVCLWLASTSTDPTPVVGPQAIPFDIVPAPAKVSTASVLNCANGQRATPVHARVTPAVCVRYHFGVKPLTGQKLTLTFLTPAKRTYKRISGTWAAANAATITMGSLPSAPTATAAAPGGPSCGSRVSRPPPPASASREPPAPASAQRASRR